MRSIRSWTRYDWGWIAIGLAAFGLEVAAIRDTRPGGTFTENFRWAISAGQDVTGLRRVARVCLLLATCWAIVHLFHERRNYV